MRVFEPRRHGPVVERLWGAAAAGRLPHALSFEGPEGIGKYRAAVWFAAGLLCQDGPGAPCGACGPCKRVASGGEGGNHPDLFVIDPVRDGEEQIRVGSIADRGTPREGEEPSPSLAAFLSLRAMEGGLRPVIVRESHRMNPAAQNAFLKTLEEPRAGTLLVLESHRPQTLLPTILSRLVRLRFERLLNEDCREVLVEHGLDGATARELARLAQGSPGKALLLHGRGILDARRALVRLLRGEATAADTAGELWDLDGDFPGRTPAARTRERVRTVLELALELQRDRLSLACGRHPDELGHGDLVADLSRPPEQRLEAGLSALVECRGDVDRNLGPEAVLDRALLVLSSKGVIMARV